MDLNGLFNMLTKMVVRSAVDVGVDYAARKGKPESEMTPEEKEQAKRARDLAGRTKEIQKVTRRLWR
jgi:ribonuclease PH